MLRLIKNPKIKNIKIKYTQVQRAIFSYSRPRHSIIPIFIIVHSRTCTLTCAIKLLMRIGCFFTHANPLGWRSHHNNLWLCLIIHIAITIKIIIIISCNRISIKSNSVEYRYISAGQHDFIYVCMYISVDHVWELLGSCNDGGHGMSISKVFVGFIKFMTNTPKTWCPSKHHMVAPIVLRITYNNNRVFAIGLRVGLITTALNWYKVMCHWVKILRV